MSERHGNLSKVTSTFLHVGLNHIDPSMGMVTAPAAADPALAIPEESPLDAVNMALEQIRAFVDIHSDGRVQSDGTISRIANANDVAGIIDGFLDYLQPLCGIETLADLSAEIHEAKRQCRNAHDLLNSYIRILGECRERLLGPSDAVILELAERAEEDIIEEALMSPHLTLLPNGTLVGDPAERTQKLLLATAKEYLEQFLALGYADEDTFLAQTLLTRARNAYALSLSTSARMEVVNQILAYWRHLRAVV